MVVYLTDLVPGEYVDAWHSLSPLNLTTKGDVGSLRVKSKYLHEVIMPLKEYTSLKEVCMIHKKQSMLFDNGLFFHHLI